MKVTLANVQPLQLRVDLSYDSRIIHVYCAIDGQYRYRDYCSTPFEGQTYGWILNAGIPIDRLNDGPHSFSVLIDTKNRITNIAFFRFKATTPQFNR